VKQHPTTLARLAVACVALALAFLFGLGRANAAPISEADRLVALQEAQAAYDRGIAAKTADPAEARKHFADAANGFRTLIAGGADNPGIHFNLGNAYVQSGDLGHGIASYLRALRASPGDRSVEANLATARSDVRLRLPGEAATDFGGLIAFWRVVPESFRLMGAVTLWIAAWSLAGAALLGLRLPRAVGLLRNAAFALALLLAATIATDRWLAAHRPLAVVTADEVTLRKGNGDGFAAQIAELLTPGVECTILEERPDWLRVRLQDGTEGWLRTNAVERV
jgi:hypothetical protein